MFQPSPFHPSRPTLVAPVGIDSEGKSGPTRKQARGPRWRTSSHGFYVPVHVDRSETGQRAVEAAALLQPGEAVSGWAALGWQRGRWFNGAAGDGTFELPVVLVTKRHVLTQPGIDISQEFLPPGELVEVDGLPITHARRSVSYEMRYADSLDRAIVALDMAAYSDLVSIAEMVRYIAALMAPTGVGQARQAAGLADENAWSPQEVMMRRVWTVRGERPRPLCNAPIFDRTGRHIGTPDLLDPVAGVIGEYDSALHLVGSQRTKDVRREGDFRALGLEYVTMLGSDRADDYASFLARLGTSYRNARFAAEHARPWTITPPHWWIDTTTVEARRNLTPELRERLLRHRRVA